MWAWFHTPHQVQKQKKAFIERLATYARATGHQMIIVFDGGGMSYLTREKVHGIKVLYSGYRQTADDVIKELIERHYKEEAMLASSDRELQTYAGSHGVINVGAMNFKTLVDERLELKPRLPIAGSTKKLHDEVDEALDALMMGDEQKVPLKDAIKEDAEAPHAKTLSKSDRAILKKIKKL